MRILERDNTQLFFGVLVTLLMAAFMSANSYAAVKPISCQTNFGEKSFTIDRASIAFHKEDDRGRSISSVLDSVTKKSHKGFRKTTYRNGFKHLIHIENESNFNSNNDFLAVTSPKGHKMTYPISCSRME